MNINNHHEAFLLRQGEESPGSCQGEKRPWVREDRNVGRVCKEGRNGLCPMDQQLSEASEVVWQRVLSQQQTERLFCC